MQTSNIAHLTTAQLLTRAPYVDLKPRNKGRYVCTVCRLVKKPQKPPKHTSEHVKSQKLPGGMPPDPQSIVGAPLYVFVPGPHNPLGGPVVYFVIQDLDLIRQK